MNPESTTSQNTAYLNGPHAGEPFSGKQSSGGAGNPIREDSLHKEQTLRTKINVSPPAAASSTYELSEHANSGMRSSLPHKVVGSKDMNDSFVIGPPFYSIPIPKSLTLCPSSTPHPPYPPEASCKVPVHCTMPDHLRTSESAMCGSPHSGKDFVVPDGLYGGGTSPPEFCNLLGQDQHVLMKNTQHVIARNPLSINIGAQAIPDHLTLDYPNTMVPCDDDGRVVAVDMNTTTQRQPGVKGQWGVGEDRILSKLVKRYGTRRWSLISTFMASELTIVTSGCVMGNILGLLSSREATCECNLPQSVISKKSSITGLQLRQIVGYKDGYKLIPQPTVKDGWSAQMSHYYVLSYNF